MDDDRRVHVARPAEDLFQLAHVVSVDRAEIVKAHLGKNVGRDQMRFDPLLERMVEAIERRKMHKDLAILPFEFDVARLHAHGLQHLCRAADVLGDGHVVVVEDHDDRLAALRGVG